MDTFCERTLVIIYGAAWLSFNLILIKYRKSKEQSTNSANGDSFTVLSKSKYEHIDMQNLSDPEKIEVDKFVPKVPQGPKTPSSSSIFEFFNQVFKLIKHFFTDVIRHPLENFWTILVVVIVAAIGIAIGIKAISVIHVAYKKIAAKAYKWLHDIVWDGYVDESQPKPKPQEDDFPAYLERYLDQPLRKWQHGDMLSSPFPEDHCKALAQGASESSVDGSDTGVHGRKPVPPEPIPMRTKFFYDPEMQARYEEQFYKELERYRKNYKPYLK